MHNREELYMQLWEHTDRLGILKHSQYDLAAMLGIPYQRLSVICSEYQKAGYMKKYRHKFQMRNPDRITAEDWAEFGVVRKSA